MVEKPPTLDIYHENLSGDGIIKAESCGMTQYFKWNKSAPLTFPLIAWILAWLDSGSFTFYEFYWRSILWLDLNSRATFKDTFTICI